MLKQQPDPLSLGPSVPLNGKCALEARVQACMMQEKTSVCTLVFQPEHNDETISICSQNCVIVDFNCLGEGGGRWTPAPGCSRSGLYWRLLLGGLCWHFSLQLGFCAATWSFLQRPLPGGVRREGADASAAGSRVASATGTALALCCSWCGPAWSQLPDCGCKGVQEINSLPPDVSAAACVWRLPASPP